MLKIFSPKKLTTKLALQIGIALILVFTILITLTTTMMRGIVQSQASSNLRLTAQSNAIMLQDMLTSAEIANQNIVDYLTKRFEDYIANPLEEDMETAINSEVVDGLVLSLSSYQTESYFLNTFWSQVNNNDLIFGMGAMFAPYAFDQRLDKFGIYVDRESAAIKSSDVYFDDDYFNADYYTTSVERGKTYITEPYIYEGSSILTVATPIILQDMLIAVVTTDIDLNAFTALTIAEGEFDSLFTSVINENMNYIIDLDSPELTGTSYYNNFTDQAAQDEFDSYIAQKQPFAHNVLGFTIYYNPITIGDITWWTQSGISDVNLFADTTFLTYLLIGACLVSFVILLFLTIIITSRLLSPLKTLMTVSDNITKGSFTNKLSVKSADEIGVLSNRFNKMSDNLERLVAEIQSLLYQMSQSDFDLSSISDNDLYVGELAEIKSSFVKISQQISLTMNDIKDIAFEVTQSAEQVAYGAQTLAQGTTEQAANIEVLKSSIEDLSEHINKNGEYTIAATELTKSSEQIVITNRTKINDLMKAISEIEASSTNIGKIIKTIEDIAFQTNILALNAAVEAARAGEAGKSFSVVADEVRNLAQKSADATKSTAAHINATLSLVKTGITLAKDANSSFESVSDAQKEYADLIDKISTVSQQQLLSVDSISHNIQEVSEVVQTNAATSQQSAAASEELSVQATTLSNLVSHFKLIDKN